VVGSLVDRVVLLVAAGVLRQVAAVLGRVCPPVVVIFILQRPFAES